MNTVLVTAPVLRAVELAEAKQHMRIDHTNDDQYIEALCIVACDKAEKYLRRKLITQTWKGYLDDWPEGNSIILPFGKVQGNVTHVKYTDTDSTQTTWSATEYNTDNYSDPGRVVLEYGYTWPNESLHPQNPIEIQWVCGYGDTGESVEPMIIHAIKIMIADMYENREDVLIGQPSIKLNTVKALLFPHILWKEPS